MKPTAKGLARALARDSRLEEVQLPDGRTVRLDGTVSVDGLTGRYRWLGRVCRDGSLELFGGPEGRQQFRCVAPSRVRTVHRIDRTRKGQET